MTDSIVVIPAPALREAIAYAREHNSPLLRRMCTPIVGEPVIVACDYSDGEYQLAPEEVETGKCPRRAHLEWVRNRIDRAEPPDALYRTFGKKYVDRLVDAASKAEDDERGFEARAYAKAYGGPHRGTEDQIAVWLDQEIDIFGTDAEDDAESLIYLLADYSQGTAVLLQLRSHLEGTLWQDPDSGEPIGSIELGGSPGFDDTLSATSAAALTCAQWTADLLGIPLRFEVRKY